MVSVRIMVVIVYVMNGRAGQVTRSGLFRCIKAEIIDGLYDFMYVGPRLITGKYGFPVFKANLHVRDSRCFFNNFCYPFDTMLAGHPLNAQFLLHARSFLSLFPVCKFKYRIDQLVNFHLALALYNGIAHAALNVAFHDNAGHAAECFFSSGDLVNDINAVLFLFHHFHDAPHLAFNPPESGKGLFFDSRVDHQFSPSRVLTKHTPPGYTVKVNDKTADVKVMILMRSLYTIMLGTMLALAVNLIPTSDVQAMGTDCRCPAGQCSCSCCTQHEAEDPAPVLQPSGEVAPGTCACSAGPNPFSADGAMTKVYVDSPKKRFFQPISVYTAGEICALAVLPLKRYKPPGISRQGLYLLNSTFRI
jgi:hypothetical protein